LRKPRTDAVFDVPARSEAPTFWVCLALLLALVALAARIASTW
jgi:hypothetical protein